jgi:hypothetical protein
MGSPICLVVHPTKEFKVNDNASLARWLSAGLFALPLYGALTLWSSIEPQPDPGTQFDAWARFVTTNEYVIGHLVGSGGGLIAGIFGTFALGAVLAGTRARNLGLIGMVIAILGAALFLLPMGVSTFAAPAEGFAYLASGMQPPVAEPSLAGQLMALSFLVVIVLGLVGNVLLGIAIWRSHVLPKWAGALWAAAPILMYPLGVVYALIINVHSTPPTVPIGAAVMMIAGLWLALGSIRALGTAVDGGVRAVSSHA